MRFVRLLLESTPVSQCRHDAMARGSQTLVAGPLERLTATSMRHNKVGASPWSWRVLSGLLARGKSLAPSAPLSPSSSRVGNVYGMGLASYHPEGCYTAATSPVGNGDGLGLQGGDFVFGKGNLFLGRRKRHSGHVIVQIRVEPLPLPGGFATLGLFSGGGGDWV